jgi:uncharacterized protein (TIGR03067 family)
VARRLIALLILVPLAARADDAPDPEPRPADLKKLEGEWELTTLRNQGRDRKIPAGIEWSLTIAKGKITSKVNLRGRGRNTECTIKIDSRKSPRHIDQTDTTTRQTTQGIYKLEKDELTIASGPAGARPKDFATATDVMVFKRKKK